MSNEDVPGILRKTKKTGGLRGDRPSLASVNRLLACLLVALLGDFEALLESLVPEHHLGLGVAFGLGDFAFAAVAAESNIDTTDLQGRIRVQLASRDGATALHGLLCGDQLVIGLRSKLA